MLVKDWMSKDLITVKATDSVIKAQILLKDHKISRLPVMDEGNLLGIIAEWRAGARMQHNLASRFLLPL